MEKESETEARKIEPSIRTMKTDISEFLKTSKSSLISVLARQTKWQEYRGERTKPIWLKVLVWSLAAGVVAMAAAVTYLQLARPASPIVSGQPTIPPNLIFFEDAKEIDMGKTRREFKAALAEVGRSQGETGSLNRLIFMTKNEAGVKQIAKSEEFFGLSDGGEFTTLSENISAPPQFFVYYLASGPTLGMLMEARNPSRAFQNLLAGEAMLQQKLEPMFLGSPPPLSLEPFKDVTYRNTDFRYLEMDPVRELGIAYVQFPPKRLIAITTSIKAMRLTIDRLFENR